jgi:hypothetical protein
MANPVQAAHATRAGAHPASTILARGALALAVWLAVGCQATPEPHPGDRPHPTKANSVEITPADDEFVQHRSGALAAGSRPPSRRGGHELTETEVYSLPKFSVSRTGFRKLGLSVVTNTEVAVGGAIEWMQVGVVIPGSPAGQRGLFTGIEILAIDDVPIARLSREEMLHRLFERESGERVRLLVYSRQFGSLPRFIVL